MVVRSDATGWHVFMQVDHVLQRADARDGNCDGALSKMDLVFAVSIWCRPCPCPPCCRRVQFLT